MIKILQLLLFSNILLSDSLTFYDLEAISITGDTISMSKYSGKNVLIVNVASNCGFTSQYTDLQKLYTEYNNNLEILGFPSNDFFNQEPGNSDQILQFCKRNYGVTFQMFDKIHVKGKNRHPVYNWLSDKRLNGWNNSRPSWNFTKYLINEQGQLLNYYNSRVHPLDTSITNYLQKNKRQ